MTGGNDILYLITLRNLEIHLVIGLCCFEVCFGTGLLTGLQWYPCHVIGNFSTFAELGSNSERIEKQQAVNGNGLDHSAIRVCLHNYLELFLYEIKVLATLSFKLCCNIILSVDSNDWLSHP